MSQKAILSEKELNRFHSDGFTYTDQITTFDDVAYVREIFDQMFQERLGREEGNQFDLAGSDEEGKEASLPQIKDPARYAPELKESKLIENASTALSQLFGETVEPLSTMPYLNPRNTALKHPGTRMPHTGIPTISIEKLASGYPFKT